MDDKITLDRDTFKVLAADTRVDILKSISSHKKTLTNLSEEFGMSPSTVKEHLDRLVSANLIYADDKGMKWKYYKLTSKGENLIRPSETKVWILLATSLLMLGCSLVVMYSGLNMLPFSGVPSLQTTALKDLDSARAGGVMQASTTIEIQYTSTTLEVATTIREEVLLASTPSIPAPAENEVSSTLPPKPAGYENMMQGAPNTDRLKEYTANNEQTSTSITTLITMPVHVTSTTSALASGETKSLQSTTTIPLITAGNLESGQRIAAQTAFSPRWIMYLSLIFVVVSTLLVGASAGYLLKRRIKLK